MYARRCVLFSFDGQFKVVHLFILVIIRIRALKRRDMSVAA